MAAAPIRPPLRGAEGSQAGGAAGAHFKHVLRELRLQEFGGVFAAGAQHAEHGQEASAFGGKSEKRGQAGGRRRGNLGGWGGHALNYHGPF